MSVIDVLFMAIVTAIVAVALYSSAGCGAANFQVMDGEEDAAQAEETKAVADTEGSEVADTGELHQTDSGGVPESSAMADSAVDSKTTESDPTEVVSCTHSNGLGQSYDLCVSKGTPGVESSYSLDMAKRARAAWTTPGTDGEGACADGAPLMVWRKTATSCAAWAYTNGVGAFAGTAGRVYLGSTACSCPSASCAAWN